MLPRKALGLVAFVRTDPTFLNPKIAKDTVVTIPAVLFCEQTEEKKDVSDANRLLCEMPLSSAILAEGAAVPVKHWIFMARVVRAQPSLRAVRHPRHYLAQP